MDLMQDISIASDKIVTFVSVTVEAYKQTKRKGHFLKCGLKHSRNTQWPVLLKHKTPLAQRPTRFLTILEHWLQTELILMQSLHALTALEQMSLVPLVGRQSCRRCPPAGTQLGLLLPLWGAQSISLPWLHPWQGWTLIFLQCFSKKGQ